MPNHEISSKVVPFLKNASYYCQKGNQYFQQNKLEKALIFFKKTIEVEPENPFHHYNLACLLSKMGYFDQANQIFAFIVYDLDPSLTECFFLMAVNYWLMDNYEKTRYYLNLYLQLSPEGEMVIDAEDLLFVLTEEGGEKAERGMPIGEGKRVFSGEKQKEGEELWEDYREDRALGKLLWESLYQNNEQVVEKAIQIYGLLPQRRGENALREFVKNPWIKQRLRLQALLHLKNMGIKKPVIIFEEGAFKEIDLLYYPLLAPRWLDKWQQVLDCALINMRSNGHYHEGIYEDVQAIWIDYINNIYPRLPAIKKTETWAAALEYAAAKFHFLSVTQEKLARQYSISSASISHKYRELNRVLSLEERAFHQMLMLMKQEEEQPLK